MLQKLRDGANIDSYTRYISGIEEYVGEISSNLYSFLKEKPRNMIVAYHRHGYLPASIMYWFMVTMDNSINLLFNESDALSYYILPYREESKIVFFSTNPYTSSTLNLLQTGSLTGYDVLLVTMTPRDERVKSIYSRYNVLYIDREDEMESTLIMVLTTYYALSKLYRDSLGIRGKHIYEHVVEGLSPVIGELIDRYIGVFEKTLRLKRLFITSSKLLEPVSLYIVEAYRRLGVETYYQKPEYIVGDTDVLLLSTSVEEYLARELRFKYRVMNISLNEIILNTDPLEAQIYLSLLAYYLIYSLGKK